MGILKMKNSSVLFIYLFIYMTNIQAQTYTLNSNEILAALNIEPFKKTDTIIDATITITNLMSVKIYIPLMKFVENKDYFFYIIDKRLCILAGMREFSLGINRPGMIELKTLLPGETEIYSVSIHNIEQLDVFDVQEIVFRVEYLSQKANRKIIQYYEGKTMIKGEDYMNLLKVLRSTFKY